MVQFSLSLTLLLPGLPCLALPCLPTGARALGQMGYQQAHEVVNLVGVGLVPHDLEYPKKEALAGRDRQTQTRGQGMWDARKPPGVLGHWGHPLTL